MKCDRCKRQTGSSIMSRFNTDILCPECETVERMHPDYEHAASLEREAVLRGEFNFPGVGLPADLFRPNLE